MAQKRKSLSEKPTVLRVKSKKCPLCGEWHVGAVKVCEKCKEK